jgi:hypothetical protein
VKFTNKDSHRCVLVILSCLEGKATEWASLQCEKWKTQLTEFIFLLLKHEKPTEVNISMETFWKLFMEEWGDVQTWIEAETKLFKLFQCDKTVVDFWTRFRDLSKKANYDTIHNPTLCGLFRRKLAYRIQNAWTQPGQEELQFFNIFNAYNHALRIE